MSMAHATLIARGLVSRTVALDEPVDLLGTCADRDGFAWVKDGEGLVGWGRAASIEPGTGPGRFRRASEVLAGLLAAAEVEDGVGVPGTGPLGVGAFTFDPQVPGSRLVVPSVVIGRRSGRSWMTVSGVGELPPFEPLLAREGPAPWAPVEIVGSSVTAGDWMRAVSSARRAIHAGRLDKVVLARDLTLWSEETFRADSIVQAMAAAYPECFSFSFDGIVGSTPELLVRRVGDCVESMPLAGSAPRSDDVRADRRLGDALSHSAKDRSEHSLTVGMIRERLAPLCRRLDIDAEPWLLRLANVQHLATRLEGRLTEDRSSLTALELAGVLHPSPAVCGVPAAPAMAAVRSLEGMGRARYAGPLGWVDASGDGEWGLALRCTELDGRKARLFAGAGIVAESDPVTELEEVKVKMGAVLNVLLAPEVA
ncbi:MAG: isochorismate synthase [Actinobacteria bacterium]|nr:isochorismate synthase [Actinomycetota bacterium]